jgi:hypothetical protein
MEPFKCGKAVRKVFINWNKNPGTLEANCNRFYLNCK